MKALIEEMIKRPHPALVHTSIALFPLSSLFLILFWIYNDPALLKASYWCFLLGALSTIPVTLTGFLDYVRLKNYSDQAKKVLNLHVANGILVTVLSVAGGIYFALHSPVNDEGSAGLNLFAACDFLISFLVLAQGAVAALMVYQHKLGVDGETRSL